MDENQQTLEERVLKLEEKNSAFLGAISMLAKRMGKLDPGLAKALRDTATLAEQEKRLDDPTPGHREEFIELFITLAAIADPVRFPRA